MPVVWSKALPPEAAAYQSVVSPALADAVSITVPVPQREVLLAVGADGSEFTVTVLVAVAFEQAPVPVTV